MRFALILALVFFARLSFAQTNATAPVPPKPAGTAASGKAAGSGKSGRSPATTAQLQAALDQLTKSNQELLDLLKTQQAVLQDIQFDRRQQSRQIESLEERLEEARLENSQLENKIGNLEAASVVPHSSPTLPPPTFADSTNAVPTTPPSTPVENTPPPPPSTYLPPPDSEGMPGTLSWHRLFTLKGQDGQNSDLFQIQGRTWRVLWHNQDQPGKVYENTSALFINAFPKNDTIPQKVVSKLGSGGSSSELNGPGTYYLKIEASGGSWELAVEDFR